MADDTDLRARRIMATLDSHGSELARELGLPDSEKYDLLAAVAGRESGSELAPATAEQPVVGESGQAASFHRIRAMTEALLPRLHAQIMAVWPIVERGLSLGDLAVLGQAKDLRRSALGASFLSSDKETQEILQIASLFAWAELPAPDGTLPGKEAIAAAARSRGLTADVADRALGALRDLGR